MQSGHCYPLKAYFLITSFHQFTFILGRAKMIQTDLIDYLHIHHQGLELIMSIKISDVAKLAGVSTATVSHVINETRFVAGETKSRVLEAIHTLGYTPNASARMLKTGKTRLIGLVIPDLANQFFSTIGQQLEDRVRKGGYCLIIANTKETCEIEREHLKMLTSGIVDGIALASTVRQYADIQNFIPDRFPCVLFDRYLKNCAHDSVTISSAQAMRNATMALIERGHRKIGYIAGLSNISTTNERLSAFCKTLEQNGLPVQQELIQHGDSISARTSASVDRLVEQNCTAIVTSNSLMSVQASYRLSSLGIGIGHDIDLLAYKDYEFYNTFLSHCDLIVQPVMEFGNYIADTLIERIESPNAPLKEKVLTSYFQPKPV